MPLAGIRLVDPDMDINLVRVLLRTSNGGLLSSAQASLADFNSWDFCYAQLAWQCQGDGSEDQEMGFIASPSEAQLLLASLEYSNPKGSLEDVVNVTVFDGSGTNCLSADQLHREDLSDLGVCFETTIAIEVTVLG